MKPLRLILIAAASRNGVLAVHGKIPWHLPRDIAHFRARTAGHWLLLGRTTYDQMTGWFRPGHVPVVLTARKGYPVPGGWAVASVPEALALASRHSAGELLVCGGGQVYAATLPFADEVILTTVETSIDSPEATRFPELPPAQWTLLETLTFPENPDNNLPMKICRFERLPPASPAAELT